VRLCSRYVVVTKALETAGCRYFRQRVATEHGISKLETSPDDNNRVFDSNTITTTTNAAAGPAFSMLVHELQRRRTQNDGKRYADICKKKLQFIHTVNGDLSKTTKIIKGTINHTNIA